MKDSRQLISELESAMAKLQSAIDRFPVNRREEVLFGQWSLKDMLAHFSGWNLLTIKELTMLQNGLAVDKWTGGGETDDFNRQSVNQRKDKTWNEVYGEFCKSQELLVQKYKDLTVEDWNSQFGPQEGDTPFRSINIDIKHIGTDHFGEIEGVEEVGV